MTIHSEHPFRDAEVDQVRRLRGRVGATVSLWTAGASSESWAGLTVSSWMVVAGTPGRLVAAIDPDSSFFAALASTGRAVVHLLRWEDRDLAEAFAGMTPAPGGPFTLGEFEQTAFGPRLVGPESRTGVHVEGVVETGWSQLVTVTIEDLVVGDAEDWLVHRAGRYQRP